MGNYTEFAKRYRDLKAYWKVPEEQEDKATCIVEEKQLWGKPT